MENKKSAEKTRRNRLIVNNKILKWLPLGIAFVLIIIIIVLVIWYFFANQKVSFEEPVYHYYLGAKLDYPDGIELRNTDGTVYYVTEEASYAADGSPLILDDGAGLFLTESMGYTNPARDVAAYRVNYFSSVKQEGDFLCIEHNGIRSMIDGGFLYDGNGTVIFLENAVIEVGTMQYEVPALSYVKCYYRDSLEIYNAASGQYDYVMLVDMDTCAVFEGGYRLDLGTNILTYRDEERILFSSIEAMGVLK